MTVAVFSHIDPASCNDSTEPFIKPFTKVDDSGNNFSRKTITAQVHNIRGQESTYTIDNSGFQVHHSPAAEKLFTDDSAVRTGYYAEVEHLLRATLPGVSKVVIFDHTIRRRTKSFPRQPVQQVHVDQTTAAAVARVRRHLPPAEADKLLKGRYQIINVWRPIGYAASDFPLAVIDWRTTQPQDFLPVDLLYPVRKAGDDDDGDDRGKENANPLGDGVQSADPTGYEVKGETMAVAPSERHQFYYVKDMTPDEVMFIKCFDSTADGLDGGVEGRAKCTPHSAFVDPETPKDAKGRQSIEVRCLVFYE